MARSKREQAFTAARLPKALFAAAQQTAKHKNISVSELIRSALARAVEETTVRRRKPPKTLETLEGGGVDPPT